MAERDDSQTVLMFCSIVAAIALLLELFLAPWQALPSTFFGPADPSDNSADLLAQQQMAAAAWIAAGFTAASFIVGLATLIYLARTFATNRDAAKAALQSVELARVQEAADIAVTGAFVQFLGDESFQLALNFSNTGRAVARGVTAQFELSIRQRSKIGSRATETLFSTIFVGVRFNDLPRDQSAVYQEDPGRMRAIVTDGAVVSVRIKGNVRFTDALLGARDVSFIFERSIDWPLPYDARRVQIWRSHETNAPLVSD